MAGRPVLGISTEGQVGSLRTGLEKGCDGAMGLAFSVVI